MIYQYQSLPSMRPGQGPTLHLKVRSQVWYLLIGYGRRHVDESGMEVQLMLTSEPPLINESWNWMKGGYKTATNHPLNLSH